MIDLDAYLSQTRTGHVEVFRDLNENEVRHMADMAHMLAPQTFACNAVLTRTLQRRSEILFLKEEAILIFDLQAFSVFNTLTRLLYWGSYINSSIAYFGKILAEEGIVLASPPVIQCGYELFRAMTPFWQARPRADYPTFAGWMSFYYLFVLLHEYSHASLRHETSFRDATQMLGEASIASGLAADWKEQTRHKYRRLGIDKNATELYISSFQAMEDFIQDNAKSLREELICDNVSLMLLIEACSASSLTVAEAFKFAWLSLRHLQVIAKIRAFAGQLKFGVPKDKDIYRINVISARVHRMYTRFELILSQENIANKIADRDEILNEIRLLSFQYDTYIDNVLESNFFPLVLGWTRTWKQEWYPRKKSLASCMEEAETFGWLPYQTRTPYVRLTSSKP